MGKDFHLDYSTSQVLAHLGLPKLSEYTCESMIGRFERASVS